MKREQRGRRQRRGRQEGEQTGQRQSSTKQEGEQTGQRQGALSYLWVDMANL